jgi:hypothetical protein
MKKLFCFIFGFGTLFFPLTLNASLDVGEGARLCKEYAKKPLDKKPSYIHWVQGFFSAFNALDPKTHSILGEGKDYNWVREWLDNYCKSNPQMYFGEAVRILIEELYPNRIQNQATNRPEGSPYK